MGGDHRAAAGAASGARAGSGTCRDEPRRAAGRREASSPGEPLREVVACNESLLDAGRDGRDAERRQRRVRGSVAGGADHLRGRGRDGNAQAGDPRHRRARAGAPRRRRALRNRMERDPLARASRRRQDLLRRGGRRRVRVELHPRLDRRSRRLAGRRLRAQHREGLRYGAPASAVPALLRRVRLRRAAPRQHPRPGVAADGQSAAHLARGPPRRAEAARPGRDELDCTPRPCSDQTRTVRSPHPDRSSGRRGSAGDLRDRARRPADSGGCRAGATREPHRGDDSCGDLEDRRHGCVGGLPAVRAERRAAASSTRRVSSTRSSVTAARTARPSSTGPGTRSSSRPRSRRSCSRSNT